MAEQAYYSVETEIPIYKEDFVILNTNALLEEKFSFSGVGSDTNLFTLSTTGTLTSNNAGAYIETGYEDEETGEAIYEGVTAQMQWTPKTNISNLYFDWEISSEETYDILYIYQNSTVLVEASGEQSGTVGPLDLKSNDTLIFEYVKDGSVDDGDDTAKISNIAIRSQNQVGTEIKMIAKKVNNIYVGIDNIAKQIIKGYIGIEGVARPFWGLKSLRYQGTLNLSSPISGVASSLRKTFVARRDHSISTYDKNLTCLENAGSLTPALNDTWSDSWTSGIAGSDASSAEMSFDNFVAFATGSVSITTIDEDLTSVGWPWHGPYSLGSNTYTNLRSFNTASTSDYAFIGGGQISRAGDSSYYYAYKSAVPYSKAGTIYSRINFPSNVTANIGSCNFNNATIWAGGFYGNEYTTTYYEAKGVCKIDNTLTATALSDLSNTTSCPICVAIGKSYAIIAGGGETSGGQGLQRNTVYAYGPYGTQQTLSYTLHPEVAAEMGLIDEDCKALFRSYYSSSIDTIDTDLTLTTIRANADAPGNIAIQKGLGTRLGLLSLFFGGTYYKSSSFIDYPHVQIYSVC